MKFLFQPGEGDALKLGPPCAGEILIKVDPQQTGGSFAGGVHSLLPGAHIPVHRHAEQDEMLFIHKGQGRATVNDQTTTVVPGVLVHVPRGAWHGLRNTGTGALQVVWMVTPPGLEKFFRELSQAGAGLDAAGMEAIAHRHGIEFRPAEGGAMGAPDAAAPATPEHRGRHRRHRRGRGGGAQRPAPPQVSSAASAPPAASQPASTTVSQAAAAPAPGPSQGEAAPPGGHRRRRRGGRRHRREPGQPSSSQAAPSTAAPEAAAKPTPKPQRASPQAGGPPRARGGYRRRVKEVYMGGRWVKVEGEGPVISS